MSTGTPSLEIPRVFLEVDELADQKLAQAGLNNTGIEYPDEYRLRVQQQVLDAAAAKLGFWMGQEVSITSEFHYIFCEPGARYEDQQPLLGEGQLPGTLSDLYVGSFAQTTDAPRVICLALGLETSIPETVTKDQAVRTLTPIRDITELGLVFGDEMN